MLSIIVEEGMPINRYREALFVKMTEFLVAYARRVGPNGKARSYEDYKAVAEVASAFTDALDELLIDTYAHAVEEGGEWSQWNVRKGSQGEYVPPPKRAPKPRRGMAHEYDTYDSHVAQHIRRGK